VLPLLKHHFCILPHGLLIELNVIVASHPITVDSNH